MSRKSPKFFSGERKRVFLLMESVQIYPCGFFWRTPEDLTRLRLKIGHFETSTTEIVYYTAVFRTISSAFLSTDVTCRQERKNNKKKQQKKHTIFHLLLGNFNARYFLTLQNHPSDFVTSVSCIPDAKKSPKMQNNS